MTDMTRQEIEAIADDARSFSPQECAGAVGQLLRQLAAANARADAAAERMRERAADVAYKRNWSVTGDLIRALPLNEEN